MASRLIMQLAVARRVPVLVALRASGAVPRRMEGAEGALDVGDGLNVGQVPETGAMRERHQVVGQRLLQEGGREM